MHSDPVAALILSLAIILIGAKLGGEVAVRLKQPSVLGELFAGVLLGNLKLVGVSVFDALGTDPTLDLLARLGVIVLLFEVGLESTVGQMMKVGVSALLVATVGVIAPFALGLAVTTVVLPGESIYAHVFVAAILCATSVGVTARVFKDLGVGNTREARIVLGAAVIDDVQGLIVLAVVSGIIAAANGGGSVSVVEVGGIVGKAGGFLIGALVVGVALSKRLFRVAARLRARGALLATGLSLCFLLAWTANLIGLAPIVGAFAAGLILEDAHSAAFKERGEHGLDELVAPISSLLSPVFFVLMGMKTDLSVMAHPDILGLAALLTVAGIAGKQVCGLAVLKDEHGVRPDRLTIGIGMIPRGEVGLIFANIGLGLSVAGQPVVTTSVFSAVVVMVIATTVVTPPLLRWALERQKRALAAPAAPAAPASQG